MVVRRCSIAESKLVIYSDFNSNFSININTTNNTNTNITTNTNSKIDTHTDNTKLVFFDCDMALQLIFDNVNEDHNSSTVWSSTLNKHYHISKEWNWLQNMDPMYRSFSTFCTHIANALFAIFQHASKHSMLWSRRHDISKACFIMKPNPFPLLLSRCSSRFCLFERFLELFHWFREYS